MPQLTKAQPFDRRRTLLLARSRDAALIASVAREVVLADVLFTASAMVIPSLPLACC